MTDIGNKFLAIYDNLAFVNKLSWLLEDDYNSHGIHKATAQEVFKLILQIIPNDFAIEHKDLSTKARLNIDADTIATSNSSMPLNNHNQSTKIVIYGNKQYAQHRIDCQIRIDSHANQKNNYYAGNILRLQQYLMKSTGKIKHIVYWNSSQLKKDLPLDSFIIVYQLEKCNFPLNMLVHFVFFYFSTRTTIFSHVNSPKK